MSRGRWRRSWIKIHCVESLEGSIRYQLEPDERGVWYDLLILAGICSSEGGIIADRDNRPFPHSFIANRLNIPLDLFERTLQKCVEEGRLSENDNGIRITNWDMYQSEAQRVSQFQSHRIPVDPYLKEKYGDIIKE